MARRTAAQKEAVRLIRETARALIADVDRWTPKDATRFTTYFHLYKTQIGPIETNYSRDHLGVKRPLAMSYTNFKTFSSTLESPNAK